MSNQFFTNPQEDPAAEDPFVGPGDDSTGETIGASPVGTGVARTANKRNAVFAAGAGIAVLLFFLLIHGRGGGEEGETGAQSTSRDSVVSVAVNTPTDAQSVEDIFAEATQNAAVAPAGGSTDFMSPDQFPEGMASPFDEPVQSAPSGEASLPFAPGISGMGTEVPSGLGGMPSMNAQVPSDSEMQFPGDAPAGISQAELDRQAELEERRLMQEAQNQRELEIAEARRAEEERLRGASTMIAENGNLATAEGGAAAAGAPAGASRFGGDAAATGVVNGGGTAPGASTGATLEESVLPGTMVPAVLESAYSSDTEGQVVVRLSAPLRGQNGVILPAGTQGFGTASSSGGEAGQPARVQMEISTFVTPNEQVIRGNLVGRAMDPETRAMSVKGSVDRRYGEMLLRGALSTAIGLAIASQGDERRSIYEQPSVKDEVLRDTRERVGEVIGGDVGDESSVQSIIRLDRGTQVILVFGL